MMNGAFVGAAQAANPSSRRNFFRGSRRSYKTEVFA